MANGLKKNSYLLSPNSSLKEKGNREVAFFFISVVGVYT